MSSAGSNSRRMPAARRLTVTRLGSNATTLFCRDHGAYSPFDGSVNWNVAPCGWLGEAHPHAMGLGRVKHFKESAQRDLVQPGPRIPYCYKDPTRSVFRRRNHQVSLRMVASAHGFDSVCDEIENDLLQLRPVSPNERQLGCQFGLRRNVVSMNFAVDQREGLQDRFIDVQQLLLRRSSSDQVS